MSEAQALKRLKSSKSGAPSEHTKAAKIDANKEQNTRAKNESKSGKENQKLAAGNNPAEDAAKLAAHKEHMRRRAARQVHSHKPKVLSRKTSFRIGRARAGTPEYSPIYAIRLRLTPDADASCLQENRKH